MDPKGDRLRKIQMGTLKLPESVLKSNNILLTPEIPQPGGGCLEGGARPRPVSVVGITDKSSVDTKPLMVGNDGSLKMLDTSGIPLPNDADIPLPPNLVPETDIPLPSPLSSENIPLPKDSDIPLPPDELIPLPADKPPQQQKKKVSLTRLVPTGDELLCRSCEMKFTKQVDYDTHLQTDSHQQAIEADLKEGRSHGVGLPIPKQNKKSPSHDIKPGHVSFGFIKNIGSKITIAQPFHQQRTERTVSTEIKLLKVGSESPIGKVDTPEVAVSQTGKTEKVLSSLREECQENKLLCSFVKVQSKDDSGRVLDWPKEMILYTQTEPKITYSCNPLCFDFSQLFGNKTKKLPNEGTLQENVKEGNVEGKVDIIGPDDRNDDSSSTKIHEEKKKSHKKKKKKKHKKNKDKLDDKDISDGENKNVNTDNKLPEDETNQDTKQDGAEEESTTGKKKKKRKHKRKEKDVSKEEDEKDKSEDCVEKEKKKHKKNKKKKHQSEVEDENKIGEEEKKSKKKKKSKKSKKRKRKHLSDKENEKSEVEEDLEKKTEKNGENTDTSADESDAEKDLNGKKKRKKRKKSKKKDGGSDSSDDDLESNVDKQKSDEKVNIRNGNITVKKNSVNDSGIDNEKIVSKLLAMKSSKPNVLPNCANPTVTQAMSLASKKIAEAITDKKLLVDRKRVNSESNVSESASTSTKKIKLTPKTVSGMKETIKPSAPVINPNSKVEKDESWVKIENQTLDNVKSKWDTSDSDMENALDEPVEKKKKSKLESKVPKITPLPNVQKEVKSHQTKPLVKKDLTDIKKAINPNTSQRSNMSAGSTKKTPASAKSNKKVQSPVSSRSSRSRSHSYRRSYSRSSSRSRSHSYSSTSSYSSGYSHSHRRKRKHSSSRSYSRSSRSRSRSYHRGRGRSSSYSSSYSRSYSSSRSRSRSHRRRRRRRSYTRSRTYSSSSYSSRSRSRSRSYRRKSRKKTHRRHKSTKQKPISVATTEKELPVKTKPAAVKETSKGPNVDPSDIPLPDLSGKKDDVKSEEKLAKLKDKKPRTDVGQTVAKLVESLPSDIPLPFSETSANTVSSDALPSSPPTSATKECESGFIGPKLPNTNMAPPPPPPPGHIRFPNHGPPHPGYYPNHWDHWGGPPGPWDGPGHWDGPGPGPRPYRGMRPPFDQRMAGPYDPRMRRPPPYMSRHGPMHMGPRYPGPRGPPHEYDYDYDYPQEFDTQYAEDEPPKKESPPPLPPPKAPSPKPPPPEKKEKQDKEPEQNPNIVIPPEQAEQYKQLQKQAAKHARRQRRRQQKKELGEPEEDSTSSESEPEPSEEQETEVGEEEQQYIMDEMQPQMIAVPQQVMFTQQPQPANSPGGIVVAVSNGQQILLQKQPQLVQNGLHHVQAGQPVILSQNAMLAAAASGAQPAHIVQQVPSGLQAVPTGQVLTQSHIPQGIQVIHSSSSLQHIHQLQQLQQIQQAHHIQQIQQAQAIQAHNQAVAAAHAAQQHTGPIIVGNQILVPRFGVRPAL